MKVPRLVLLALSAFVLMAASFTPAQSVPDDVGTVADDAVDDVIEQIEAEESAGGDGLHIDEIDGIEALGPMPWLSLGPTFSPEAIEAWTEIARQLPKDALIPRGKNGIGGKPLTASDSEAVGETGGNDTPETGDRVDKRFGSGPGKRGVVTISGSLSGGVVRPPIEGDCESTEDDGSIPQANPTPAAQIQVALCIGEIGDGPFGDSSGDVDFYGYGSVDEGSILILDTFHVAGSLEPANTVIGIYDAAGNLLASAEFVGFVVGHITGHEIGHFIGNWHQETFNEVDALMDAGGDFPAIAGVGGDRVFGTSDDTDPDFVEDVFNSFEGFSGVEDTAGRSVFALSTGLKQVPRGGGAGVR